MSRALDLHKIIRINLLFIQCAACCSLASNELILHGMFFEQQLLELQSKANMEVPKNGHFKLTDRYMLTQVDV